MRLPKVRGYPHTCHVDSRRNRTLVHLQATNQEKYSDPIKIIATEV